jgi:hypothetical protein
MPHAVKWLAIAAAGVTAILLAPALIASTTLPGQNTRQVYTACTWLRGTRATIVANPPQQPLTADEVLLRIATTATKLGFGRQGATVTVAIALHATGLANAANPAAPETLRYAHSTQISDGAGALGLPLTWATPAELMTPETLTAIALDHMVDSEPRWRDIDPAELASRITGRPATDYRAAAAAAQTRMTDLPTPASTTAATTTPWPTTPTSVTSAAPTTTPTAAATTLLSPPQASSAAAGAPQAAACLSALTTPIPPPAPAGPSPYGPQLASAAQRAVGTENHSMPPDAARFVAELVASTTGHPCPDTVGEQLQTGQLATDPNPGDLVFIDISADEGPHLGGIATDVDTMVTVLPGHPTPEWTAVGPNRLIRRIEDVSPTP